MRRVAIKNAAHLHDRASKLDFLAEGLCAIGRRKNRFAYVQTYFSPVDIKSGDYFDIVWPISTDLLVHQSHASTVGGRAIVKVYTLNERAGAVSNADNGNSYFSHF